jgi:hypothetical protein
MKKPLLFLCVLIVSVSCLMATESPVSSISLMINSDFYGNLDLIKNESVNLTDYEKMTLYSMHEESPTVPFVVNLLVGAGIGSFIQGDIKSGVTALIGELIGFSLYTVGYLNVYSAALNGDDSEAGATMLLLGAGAILGTRIYECIQPFSYAKKYNDQLHSALQGKAEVFVTPMVTMVNNQMALGMVGKVSY